MVEADRFGSSESSQYEIALFQITAKELCFLEALARETDVLSSDGRRPELFPPEAWAGFDPRQDESSARSANPSQLIGRHLLAGSCLYASRTRARASGSFPRAPKRLRAEGTPSDVLHCVVPTMR
jgi:hypothetical protein